MKLIVVGVGRWGGVLVKESQPMGVLVAITDSYYEAMDSAHESIGLPDAVSLHDTLEDAIRTHPSAAVVVTTPPSTHYDIALIAINAGRDVWVEKPICSHPFQAATSS